MLFRSFTKITLNVIYLSFKKIHLEFLIATIVLQIFIYAAFIEERVDLRATLMKMILQPHLFSFVLHSYCIKCFNIIGIPSPDCVLMG